MRVALVLFVLVDNNNAKAAWKSGPKDTGEQTLIVTIYKGKLS